MRTPLPIDERLPGIVDAIRAARSLVLVAEPGAGKTTRVPPAMLAAGLLNAENPNLLMLQPRRVAARAAAQRIAEENGWEIGREVGYQVRFEKRIGPATRLRVITEGILTRRLLDDPYLEGVGAVVLDEFHERSLHTDLAIALLREIRQTVRPDLIVVVMSATLDAEPVARFLGDCPIERVTGRVFPVEIENTNNLHVLADRDALVPAVVGAVSDALSRGPECGDVLVFLAGAEEIRRSQRALETLAGQHDLLMLPLYGSLPFEQQLEALRPAPRRKIILATNIAETSLTIPGVRTVIDSGLARVARYDPYRGLDSLELSRISLASATQRAGRAGRTAPGRCVRLWSASEQRAMPAFEAPEVLRVDLCATVLLLHAWGTSDPRTFDWFDKPAEASIVAAEKLLALLGALDKEEQGKITDIGRRLLELPVHPRLGRLMLAAAEAGLVEQGAALAALLEEKDIIRSTPPQHGGASGPTTLGKSDLLLRLSMLDGRGHDIDPISLRQVLRARDELIRLGKRLAPPSARARHQADEETALLRMVLLAYPDRVARRRGGGDVAAAVMVGGGGVRIAPASIVRSGEFFVAVDARQDERSATRQSLVRIASAVEPAWLEELFPQAIQRRQTLEFDPQRQRVVSRSAVYYRDLLLREDREGFVDPSAAGRVLGKTLRAEAPAWFAADEASAGWLARLRFLQRAMPEIAWPALDDAMLGDLLESACAGRRSVEEVKRSSLVQVLQSTMHYPLDRQMEQYAPQTLTVPSGSNIRLDFAAGARPVLAARLQELFGWTDTPRVANGRVPVTLHLLGPNYRPVQITEDLRSFWSTTYFQVRKDLRMRYPKHSWPEDPLTALPEAKGRRRQ